MSQSKTYNSKLAPNNPERTMSSNLKNIDPNNGSHTELPDFDRSLPMSLLRAREAVMAKFLPSLKEQELSAQQWRVIRSLDQEDGIEISELSKRCYLLKPSMSRIVQNLQTRQFIERRNVASDQRRSVLHITQKGRDLVELVAPKSEERYEFIARQFGPSKLDLLQELLEDLVIAINEDDSQEQA